MTDDLKNLLHDRAERADLAHLDADALMQQGDRVVRRRRGAVVGGLAAVAVVATAALTQLGRPGTAAPDPADELEVTVNMVGTRPDVQMWHVGPFLAFGDDRAVRVDRPMTTLTITSADVVFDSLDGEVWAVGDDGDARFLGGRAQGGIEADADGVLAAWVERGAGADETDPGVLAVADLRTDEVTRYDLPQVEHPERLDIAGLEGDDVYLEDNQRVLVLDLATGTTSALGTADDYFIDAEADVVVLGVEDPVTGPQIVARRATGDVELGDFSDYGVLSPDGRYYATDDDFTARQVVVDTRNGRRTALQLRLGQDSGTAAATSWLDEDTVNVIVSRGGRVSFASCEVPSGACTVTVEDTSLGWARRAVG